MPLPYGSVTAAQAYYEQNADAVRSAAFKRPQSVFYVPRPRQHSG
jgi:hypothetical protein